MLRIPWDFAQRLDDVTRFAQGLGRLPDTHVPPIKVTRTSRPEFGDYSTAIAHQLAPAAKMEPQLIAEEIISQLPDVVRFFMLERNPDSHINFDLDLARKQSDENPVY